MLLVCVGGRFIPALRGAITFPGPEPLQIDEVIEQAAGGGQVAFVVPYGVSWPLPIYELALMTERRAREQRQDVRIVVVTPEAAPLIMFGSVASDEVAALLDGRGINVETARSGAGAGRRHPVHRPREQAPRGERGGGPAAHRGPPHRRAARRRLGVPAHQPARARRGAEHVYAAGDGTNFPIKQGGLGTQQADAAAEEIAARAGAEIDPQPFQPSCAASSSRARNLCTCATTSREAPARARRRPIPVVAPAEDRRPLPVRMACARGCRRPRAAASSPRCRGGAAKRVARGADGP